jgi:hypothetical protein
MSFVHIRKFVRVLYSTRTKDAERTAKIHLLESVMRDRFYTQHLYVFVIIYIIKTQLNVDHLYMKPRYFMFALLPHKLLFIKLIINYYWNRYLLEIKTISKNDLFCL